MGGSLRCQDWTPDDPQTLDGQDLLAVYLESFSYIGFPVEMTSGWVNGINASLHADGCAGAVEAMTKWELENWFLGNLCKEDNTFGFKPMSSICPVSCGCKEEDLLLCPTACRNTP